MRDERSLETCYVVIEEVYRARRQARRRRRFESDGQIVDPWSYQAKMGRGTLRLPTVEYRILQFLASRPNQAFTRQRIAAAASTSRHLVTAETLGRYIHSLRAHLGFFSDYIQPVPYIGYRFKA
jgi:DNA-binding response OmpR family regulator